MSREESGRLLKLQSFSFDDLEYWRDNDAARNHILDAFLNGHRNFREFIGRREDQESGSWIGHGRHEHVEHILLGNLLHFSAGLAGHKPDRQKSPARELKQDDFAKGRRVGLGDGNHYLFGAFINPTDEWDFFNYCLAEFKNLFPEKVSGQPAHCEHDQQGDQHSQKGDAVAFGKGRTKLDQHIGEYRRQGIEVLEQELQNEPCQCDRQGDQQPGDKNISKSALEIFKHGGKDELKNGVWV